MESNEEVRKVRHPDFANRMAVACDGNNHVPQPNYGRLGWFVDQMKARFNVTITQETVRKWFAGEAKPRQGNMAHLAQLLQVDIAWLSLGITPSMGQKERRARDALADGAVNVLAGFIQMDGGRPAFPSSDDAKASKSHVDLYAIIRGAQYSIHVATGPWSESGWDISIPVSAQDCMVIGVLPIGNAQCEFVDLDWDLITSRGTRKAGAYELKLTPAYAGEWRRIMSFSDRP